MSRVTRSLSPRVWRWLGGHYPAVIVVVWLGLLSLVQPFASRARVFGGDDREQVTDTTEAAFSVVGQIQAWWGSQGTTGTGVLVGPDRVVTAAHCVYRGDLGGWADRVVFIAGRDGGYWPFGMASATDLAVPQGYTSREGRGEDVALLTLDEPIGEVAGWLTVADAGADVSELEAESAGYPTDKPGHGMYWTYGSTGPLVRGLLRTQLDAAPGQSGSPIWVYDIDDVPVLVAVMAAELDSGLANLAVPVTVELIEQLASGEADPAVAWSASAGGEVLSGSESGAAMGAPGAGSVCGFGVGPAAAMAMMGLAGMRVGRRG